MADGAVMVTKSCASDSRSINPKLFTRIDTGDGWFSLENHLTGKCLDVELGGDRLLSSSCSGGDNQKFAFAGAQLQVRHSGKCVSVDPSGQLLQRDCTGEGGQSWASEQHSDCLALVDEQEKVTKDGAGVGCNKAEKGCSINAAGTKAAYATMRYNCSES